MSSNKPLVWVAGALSELSKLPSLVRAEVQGQLEKIRGGGLPEHWKPLDQIESGVRELRIRSKEGQFRAFFIPKYAEAIYVLACTAKKNAALSTSERRFISNRYKTVMQIRRGALSGQGEAA